MTRSGPEAVDEASVTLESATVDTDNLAEDRRRGVSASISSQIPLADGFEIGDEGHDWKCSKETATHHHVGPVNTFHHRRPVTGDGWQRSGDYELSAGLVTQSRMKRLQSSVFVMIFGLLLVCGSLRAADPLWQYGRIVSVKKSVNSTTKAWVVNTPLEEEHTQYTIAVHVQDRIVVGNYEMTSTSSEPPPEWTNDHPVQVEISGDSLYLRLSDGSLRLHVTQRKSAGPMRAIPRTKRSSLRLSTRRRKSGRA